MLAMTAVTLTPREAIARHLAGQLPGTALARQLLNFGGWMAAAELGPDEQPRLVCHTDARGQRYMQLFSDPQAVQDHVRLSGKERLADLVVKVLGRAAFSTLPPDLDWLDINPLSPPEIHYGREQLAELSRLARAVEIEEVLADLPAAAEPFAQIKRYDQ